MKKFSRTIISLILVLSLAIGVAAFSFANAMGDPKDTMNIGVGKADITGPVTNISTGYNSLGDLMNGLLTRLNARAFIVEKDGQRLAYVSAELVHMTESIKPAVLKELAARGLTQYTEENLMLSATHCHSSTSNVSWYALYDLINGVPGFDEDSFTYIVNGICDAIEEADANMVPGHLVLSYGDTDIESFNRSLAAAKWNNNYDELYGDLSDFEAVCASVSKEMQVIRFISDGKDIGLLSFFPSHGTSNSIDNTLVASDHKGYACLYVEQVMGDGFVAANCQGASGDISPNMPQEEDVKLAFLRPADRFEDLDVIENQIYAGQQEADAMLKLIKGGEGVTTIELSDILDLNYTTVDFSDIQVSKEYIGDNYMPYDDIENAHTTEPCIGAGIIAGDEEGAPVDNAAEGSVRHNFELNEDGTVARTEYDFSTIDLFGLEKIMKPIWPYAMKLLQSDGYDEDQMEKVVCLAVGDLMQKTQPVQIFRIGELAIAGVSFEVSNEQSKRICSVLEDTLSQTGVEKVILSTHSNAYSQYMCTREEYAAQNYEGATDLFGPWSGAAMTQTLDGLAKDMVAGIDTDKGPGLRDSKPLLLIPTLTTILAPGVDSNDYGTLTEDVDITKIYDLGDTVSATFEGSNPRHIVTLINDGKLDADDYTYMEVQKLEGTDWVTVRTDSDPYTTYQYDSNKATVSWLLRDADEGVYRLVYNGYAKTGNDAYEAFTSHSSPFIVISGGVFSEIIEGVTVNKDTLNSAVPSDIDPAVIEGAVFDNSIIEEETGLVESFVDIVSIGTDNTPLAGISDIDADDLVIANTGDAGAAATITLLVLSGGVAITTAKNIKKRK